jgi:hypothetical protein
MVYTFFSQLTWFSFARRDSIVKRSNRTARGEGGIKNKRDAYTVLRFLLSTVFAKMRG